MGITETQLRELIKESIEEVVNEQSGDDIERKMERINDAIFRLSQKQSELIRRIIPLEEAIEEAGLQSRKTKHYAKLKKAGKG